jgi:outer membrane protein
MDIQRERATIELTERNRAVISRSLESAQNGFRVGELTRTDVAQAQARLAGADAQLVASRAAYSSALARLMQYAGIDGTDLRVSDDLKQAAAPASLSAAKSVADAEHPLIRTAIEEEKVAQSTIELAQGALRPDIYAQATAGKAWEPSSLIDSSRDATIGLRASLPLYDGGASRAVIRQAKHQQMEKRDRTSYARRVVGQQVSTAWNDYEAALAQIEARTQQVEASRIARDGVSNERQVGTRTVLDTLNADAELLDAEVGLVSAQRDAIVAAYALQAATGQLTGEKLGLFSRDSEKQRLDKTRKDWFGTSVQSAD